MNLDLLTKLVRLANNNPNENEANLAARKVCRMIEENKFQFGSNGTKTAANKVGGTWNDVKRSEEPQWSSKSPGPQTEAQKKAYEDLLNFIKFGERYRQERKESYDKETQGTWSGFKTAEEHNRDIQEKIRKEQERREKEIKERYIYVDFDPQTAEYILPDGTRISEIKFNSVPHNYKVRNRYEPSQKQKDFYAGFPHMEWDGSGWDEPKQKTETPIRPLECRKCHKMVDTGFVGPPQMFICTPCQWVEYEEERGRRKK